MIFFAVFDTFGVTYMSMSQLSRTNMLVHYAVQDVAVCDLTPVATNTIAEISAGSIPDSHDIYRYLNLVRYSILSS